MPSIGRVLTEGRNSIKKEREAVQGEHLTLERITIGGIVIRFLGLRDCFLSDERSVLIREQLPDMHSLFRSYANLIFHTISPLVRERSCYGATLFPAAAFELTEDAIARKAAIRAQPETCMIPAFVHPKGPFRMPRM